MKKVFTLKLFSPPGKYLLRELIIVRSTYLCLIFFSLSLVGKLCGDRTPTGFRKSPVRRDVGREILLGCLLNDFLMFWSFVCLIFNTFFLKYKLSSKQRNLESSALLP